MPTYASSTQLQNAIGGSAALTWLSDILNAATDSNAVSSALDWATSRIDMYATGTAGTTGTAGAMWDSTPTQAVQICIDLSIYILCVRIRRQVPEDVKATFEADMKQLEALQKGTISWVATEDPPQTNIGRVFYFGSGSTARSDNPRRTLRDTLDLL